MQTNTQVHETIIPSGGLQLKNSGTLKACLGSCVGLALYDRSHHRGCLIHLLLPQPVCNIPANHRTYYASTGVELAIEAMLDAGAALTDLHAFIAGGALIDPLTPQDLNLNIGGRTLEITIHTVVKHGIPIERIEASGVTACNMSFQPDSGQCRVEPILKSGSLDRATISRPGRGELQNMIENVLPIPQAALKIAHMLNSDDLDLSDIAGEIKKDQVLTARVLRLCNSPYASPFREITSIQQAIIHLGNKTLIQLIITAQIQQFLIHFSKGYSLCRGGMYYHALGTARLCELIARTTGRVPSDIAYTAGLLHDIGKVVLDQFIDQAAPLFYRMLYENQLDSCLAENNLLGTNHCETGLLLARQWNLPGIFCETIAGHHHPTTNHDTLVHLVYIADVFINRFHTGCEIENINTATLEPSLQTLNLSPDTIFNLLPHIHLYD